ncbi:STE3-domain-containing protein [Mollisia scopiformis]|uniref:STE3-domain-containing protein n=1 Tax=Mollisia scopiformis TaxID=149040 RepID=A0A194WY83_MOLSC|nr:STE3-domain-containing protein [Mollisia scopiformis]KUJ12931.1 STE3-domain-containing protein [Mollisia scopiformis]
MNAVALPFFALLAILVTYLPCRSFWSHRNVPAVSIVVATNVYNAMSVVNGVMWPNDDWASWWPGYGLCDLEALLRYPITMALATSLCGLSKGLADCLDTNNATVHPTAASKRRELLFNVMFCWAIPVLQMALHYVIQNGRYQIFPVFGCSDVIDDSWPTILIIMIWCPIFTFSTLYYAVILLIRLRKHRRTISSALKTSGSGFAARKYLKLVIITMSLIVIYVPVQFVFFFQVLPRKLEPYSWSRIHDPATWHLIEYQHTGDAPLIQYQGWAGIVTSFLIWAYFGFNDTAVDTYRSWLVQLGLGRIWPSLKLSRETRMMMRRSQGSSIARGSIDSHFDLVGKAMKYFDTDIRQESGATTLVDRHSNRQVSSITPLMHLLT